MSVCSRSCSGCFWCFLWWIQNGLENWEHFEKISHFYFLVKIPYILGSYVPIVLSCFIIKCNFFAVIEWPLSFLVKLLVGDRHRSYSTGCRISKVFFLNLFSISILFCSEMCKKKVLIKLPCVFFIVFMRHGKEYKSHKKNAAVKSLLTRWYPTSRRIFFEMGSALSPSLLLRKLK